MGHLRGFGFILAIVIWVNHVPSVDAAGALMRRAAIAAKVDYGPKLLEAMVKRRGVKIGYGSESTVYRLTIPNHIVADDIVVKIPRALPPSTTTEILRERWMRRLHMQKSLQEAGMNVVPLHITPDLVRSNIMVQQFIPGATWGQVDTAFRASANRAAFDALEEQILNLSRAATDHVSAKWLHVLENRNLKHVNDVVVALPFPDINVNNIVFMNHVADGVTVPDISSLRLIDW